MEEPLSKRAAAKPRSLFGNHSETAFVAPGQLADSPAPSKDRKIAKLRKPFAREVQMETKEYHNTEIVRPRFVPIRSIALPQIACPNEYATRKPITMLV